MTDMRSIPTFDDVLAALLDASAVPPMGSVVRAGEESPGAHRRFSHDDGG